MEVTSAEQALRNFEAVFGFRPTDDAERQWYLATGQRLDGGTRQALDAGVPLHWLIQEVWKARAKSDPGGRR